MNAMKYLGLLGMFMGLWIPFAGAQSFLCAPTDFEMPTFSNGLVIYSFSDFTNNSGQDLNLRWKQTSSTGLSPTWTYDIQDQLTDLVGHTCHQVTAVQQSGETLIDLSELPAGPYWLNGMLNGQSIHPKTYRHKRV